MQDNQEEKYKVISIRTPKKVVKELDRIKAETNLSRNEIIRQYIAYGLEHTKVIDDNSESL